MNALVKFGSAVLSIFLLGNLISAQDDRDLSTYVPEDANVLVMVNEAELFDSPMAQRLDWKAEKKKSYAEGKVVVPPGVEDYVLASSVDIEFGYTSWEVAMVRKSGLEPMSRLARTFGVNADSLAGKKTMALPNDTYWVRLEDDVLGSISPANRQAVGRWINRFKADKGCRISPYLCQAASFSNENKTHIIIAIDLENAFSSDVIQSKLQAIGAAGSPELEQIVESIKGVTLGVNFTDEVNAKLLVDFGQEVSGFSKELKGLVIEVLGEHGLMLDDINAWKPSADGKRFTLKGTFQESNLRQLAMMIQPSGFGAATVSAADETFAAGSSKDRASINYLKALFRLHDDIMRRDKQTAKLSSYWIERSTDEIDDLSVVGVDESIVEFSEDLTTMYHGILDRIAREKAQEKYRNSTREFQYKRDRYYRPRHRYQYRYNSRESVREQEQAEAEYSVAKKLIEIEDFAKRFRHDMAQKFGIDF